MRTGLTAARLELDARPLQALASEPAAANNQRLWLAVGLLTVSPYPGVCFMMLGMKLGHQRKQSCPSSCDHRGHLFCLLSMWLRQPSVGARQVCCPSEQV